MICLRPDRDLSNSASPRLDLEAKLRLPRRASGLVVIAQARAGSRPTLLQQTLSDGLHAAGLATCIVDLVDASERDAAPATSDLDFLTERLESVMDYLAGDPETWHLPLGVVGIDRAVPAAITLASERPEFIRSIACCCGRPDTARVDFSKLSVPTLLLAPAGSPALLKSHETAFLQLRSTSQLAVVRSGRIAGEASPLAECERLVRNWCRRFVPFQGQPSGGPAFAV